MFRDVPVFRVPVFQEVLHALNREIHTLFYQYSGVPCSGVPGSTTCPIQPFSKLYETYR